jgi:hypothetical protein
MNEYLNANPEDGTTEETYPTPHERREIVIGKARELIDELPAEIGVQVKL